MPATFGVDHKAATFKINRIAVCVRDLMPQPTGAGRDLRRRL